MLMGGGGLEPSPFPSRSAHGEAGSFNHFYLLNHFQNYCNANVIFQRSLNLKQDQFSVGEYLANMRPRTKEMTLFKKFDWRSGSQVVHPIIFQTKSYRPTVRDCQTLIDYVKFFGSLFLSMRFYLKKKKKKSGKVFNVCILQFCMKF